MLTEYRQFGPKRVNVVTIGGGTGLSTLLTGLKTFVGPESLAGISIRNLSAIVAVSDDGGSSGRLRDEFQMPPPGDIRNCMVALSEDSMLLSKLFQYRFRGEGDLGGHSFGNLFLAALSEVTGDFAEAVRLSSEILASKGHIYPATVSDVRIAATLNDGTTVLGETNISRVGGSIKRLYLDPEECMPMPDALRAIGDADIITLGPGSLYTSLLPPLLVREVAEAITRSPAVKVFICNLMTQPGETDGLSASRHIEIVSEYVPALKFDIVIANRQRITEEQAFKYRQDGAEQIGIDTHGLLSAIGTAETRYDDLLDDGEKVRHNPYKLARALLECLHKK